MTAKHTYHAQNIIHFVAVNYQSAEGIQPAVKQKLVSESAMIPSSAVLVPDKKGMFP